jgi:hypothetical protein
MDAFTVSISAPESSQLILMRPLHQRKFPSTSKKISRLQQSFLKNPSFSGKIVAPLG